MRRFTIRDLALVGQSSGDQYPISSIVMWNTASIPSGWQVCDGTNGTPDLRDLFVAGSGDAYSVGQSGGAATVSLTESEIPSHTHTEDYTAASTGSHTHGYSTQPTASHLSGGQSSFYATATRNFISAGAHQHTITGSSANTGSGSAHSNLPAYYALFYIMRLA